MKRLILLGATGSIGSSTLDIVRAHPDRFRLVGVSAHTRARELSSIATEFGVERQIVSEGEHGTNALIKMIRNTEAEIVVNAIAGACGLAPSIAALESGKDLALANKETIVMAGSLVRAIAEDHGRRIIPVDSEHAALFYLLEGIPRDRLKRLVLTASGGAFRDLEAEELQHVTVSGALGHPTWNMGPKITIDSATMANKGLEVIEAVELFDLSVDAIDVYIHRQSVIHGMVQTTDGSLYAQLSAPDMRLPIQHALTYPEELPAPARELELDGLRLDFKSPDPLKYRALMLARNAAAQGGEFPIVFNAANEVAVSAFLAERIGFVEIPDIIEGCLAADWRKLVTSVEQVYQTDERARVIAHAAID